MDLRLDYMQPAEPEKPINISAKVYKNTSNVVFCRGVAWQSDMENPIAHCVATFMKLSKKK
jgi:acyl-coenzyme A thioesterase PaaI-like protein